MEIIKDISSALLTKLDGENYYTDTDGHRYVILDSEESFKYAKNNISKTVGLIHKGVLSEYTGLSVDELKGYGNNHDKIWKVIEDSVGQDNFVDHAISELGISFYLPECDGTSILLGTVRDKEYTAYRVHPKETAVN